MQIGRYKIIFDSRTPTGKNKPQHYTGLLGLWVMFCALLLNVYILFKNYFLNFLKNELKISILFSIFFQKFKITLRKNDFAIINKK
ncbi:MAG: hypothetical protein SPE33_07130 [[Pasteurella] aerogenes]|nr:hypothetical protein [[Pasteurella] aerogenes]